MSTSSGGTSSRPQAVAIQHRPDLAAVGEGDACRSVPGFHQAGVELVEGAHRIIHVLVVRPRLRNHHHHRVRQRTPGQHQKLKRVVEHRRVAAVRIDDRQDLLHVIAEHVGFEQRLARLHPVDVAAQGVDLAVVGDVAIRMRAVPAGEGVGAEARVHQRQRRLHRRIIQILEVLGQLPGQQHALVDDGLVRQARDVPVLGAIHGGGADLAVGALADDIQLALEHRLIGQRRIARDEHLAHERFTGLGGLPQVGVVHGHGAPAEDALTLGLHDLLEVLLEPAALGRIARQKDDAAAVGPRGGQGQARLAGGFLEKGVRHLHQHTRAIAGVDLAAAGTAMIQIAQHLDGVLHDLVGFAALYVDNEADSAGIMLKLRIVKSLLARTHVRGGLRLCRHLLSTGGVHRRSPACLAHANSESQRGASWRLSRTRTGGRLRCCGANPQRYHSR